jgi:glutamate--cysteine ligase catalytic subunit
MAEGSGQITDFSKEYRQRAHQHQRIGMTPQSMPRLEEVDDMLKHSERISVSLQRMREVVFNHHQASMAEPPQDSRYQRINGYDHESQSNYGEDLKGGGFPGSDAKKPRRGVSRSLHYEDYHKLIPNKPSQRAAPPGRCHSCNRAETPEWRRGPDGARTLCNACGLRKSPQMSVCFHCLILFRLCQVDA